MKSQNTIQQYYDGQYRKGLRGKTVSQKRLRSNLQGMQIRNGSRMIDVGCGSGMLGSYLARHGVKVFGIDLSLEAARVASQPGRCTAALQADAGHLPFADQAFDGATVMGTLEHVIDPIQSLRAVSRVLKPGTQLCFVVPNSDFFLFKFLGGTGQPHEVPRNYAGWRRLFESEGLSVEAVDRDVGPGVFEGGIVRGLMRKVVLLLFNLLPIRHTYQFVFICRKR